MTDSWPARLRRLWPRSPGPGSVPPAPPAAPPPPSSSPLMVAATALVSAERTRQRHPDWPAERFALVATRIRSEAPEPAPVGEALALHEAAPRGLPPEVRAVLLSLAASPGSWTPERGWAAAALLADPTLPPDALIRLAHSPEGDARLLDHPAATDEVALALIERIQNPHALAGISGHRWVRGSRAAHTLLRDRHWRAGRCDPLSVAVDIALSAPPADYPAMVTALVQRKPGVDLARLLDDATAEQADALVATDRALWAALLGAPARDLRLAAARLMGRAASTPPSPPPCVPRHHPRA